MSTATSMQPAHSCSGRRVSFSRRERRGEYAPNTPVTDVARLLDPAYSQLSLGPSSTRGVYRHRACAPPHHESRPAPADEGGEADADANWHAGAVVATAGSRICAYVDSDGELHDPDYRLFPVFRPRPRVLGRRHTVSGRIQFSTDVERDDEQKDRGAERDERHSGHTRPVAIPYRSTHASAYGRWPARTASTRSAASFFSAASYMLQDVNSVTSAPTGPMDQEEEEESSANSSPRGYNGGIADSSVVEFDDAVFVDDCVADDDLLESAEDMSSTDSRRWSFLRRIVCNPNLDQSESTSPTLTSSTLSQTESRSHSQGRTRSRSSSGSGSRSLLQRVLRSRSPSVSTYTCVSPSPIQQTLSEPRQLVADTASEKSNAQVYVQEYLDHYSEEDVVHTPLDEEDGSAAAEEEAVLRRRARAFQLRLRTQIWRMKKRFSSPSPESPKKIHSSSNGRKITC